MSSCEEFKIITILVMLSTQGYNLIPVTKEDVVCKISLENLKGYPSIKSPSGNYYSSTKFIHNILAYNRCESPTTKTKFN